MGLLKRKPDPISKRAESLNARIAELEAQIKRLDAQVQQGPSPGQPRLRSTALPHGAAVPRPVPPAPAPAEPIFEADGQKELTSKAETPSTPHHYNDRGVRKYDLPALLRRIRDYWHGPRTSSPRLVSLLAAGSVQGLRPLRYEKRVARNRVLLLFGFLFVVLLGTYLAFWRRH